VDDDLTAYLQLSPRTMTLVIQEEMSSWIVEVLVGYIILESKLRAKEESPKRRMGSSAIEQPVAGLHTSLGYGFY
jgi:hypothetical protein